MGFRILIFIVFVYINSFADDLRLLEDNKKEALKLKDSKIKQELEESSGSWIDSWNIKASVNKSSSVSDTKSTSKKLSIGFSQDIYRSGGIEYLIEYSDEKYKYDALTLQNERSQLIYNIYDIVLQIDKYDLQLKQNSLSLQNQEIEIYIKKLQYEAGKLDLIELNNAIMAKNTLLKEKLNIKNSINNKIKELSKLTELKYTDIELLDLKGVTKAEFMKKDLSYNIQASKEKMLQKKYKMDRSDFGPKVALNGEYGYSDTANDTLDTTQDGDYYSIGASISIPLDYYKDTKLDISKKEYMIEKYGKYTLQREIEVQFDQIMDQVGIYKEQNGILKENIKLYNDLIVIAGAKVKGGYSPAFDLDILNNTKEKDILEIEINDINIKQQYALLYFKMMR